MRYFICLFVAVCLSCSMICAQDQPNFSPAQQEVLKVRNALRETALRRDMKAWSRYVADDCIFSTDDGQLNTKAQAIEHVGKLPPEYDHSVNPRDYVVHVYGDTVVINFRHFSLLLPKPFLRLLTKSKTSDFPMKLAKRFSANSLVDDKGFRFYHRH
ncbi:MAG TPA: nuclear transport factor 2 family protein [Terriglobia bacterium]|nr:nuclear transport factor 2 family protein [Terriglobia bacterium]